MSKSSNSKQGSGRANVLGFQPCGQGNSSFKPGAVLPACIPRLPKEEGTVQLQPNACYASFPDFEENNLCKKINALNMQLVECINKYGGNERSVFDSVKFSVAISTASKFLNVAKFYPDKEEALRNCFQRKDLFFSAHTGYGKSLIFQAIPIIADVLEDQLIGQVRYL